MVGVVKRRVDNVVISFKDAFVATKLYEALIRRPIWGAVEVLQMMGCSVYPCVENDALAKITIFDNCISFKYFDCGDINSVNIFLECVTADYDCSGYVTSTQRYEELSKLIEGGEDVC